MTISEILGLFGLVYILNYCLQNYFLRKYHKLLDEYYDLQLTDNKLKKLLKNVETYSYINKSKMIYELKDCLYWLLALISYEENKIDLFLSYIQKIQSHEYKSFIGLLYYLSINNTTQANHFYREYNKYPHTNEDYKNIVDYIYGNMDEKSFQKSFEKFKSSALIDLIQKSIRSRNNYYC